VMLTVFRHQRDGLVNDEMRDRVRLLIPHVRRAMRIGNLLDRSQSQTGALAAALDGLNAGVFFVDSTGHLVHTNAQAHTMLSRGDLLFAPNCRLLARNPAIDGLLRDAFAGNGKAVLGDQGVALAVTTRDGDDYVAHVLRLSSAASRGPGSAPGAVAVLFVSKAGRSPRSSQQLFAQRYKLTPTELRVALAIVEIGGVPEVADAFGISATTVKTHLQRVYQKTGINRQADLVRLVAGFTSPLAA